MDINKLREQLKIDEGVKYEVYLDHLGYKTFGIGHLVVAGDDEYGADVGHPVSEERVNAVFDEDVKKYISESEKVFPNLKELPEEAQQVIVNMCFNMGAPRLSKFKKFIAAVNEVEQKRREDRSFKSWFDVRTLKKVKLKAKDKLNGYKQIKRAT